MHKFTICMPTYNRAYIISRPLDSLVAQSFKDFEVLVIDDGSNDNVEEVVCNYVDRLDIRLIKKNNGGKYTALNTGLDNATGELFLILDTDDKLIPEALQMMCRIWEENKNNPQICGVMGRCATTEKLIGKPFPPDKRYMSYVEFHYGKGGGRYGDCCECVKTDIINKYRWPENLETKFIPESYVNNLIGLHYQLAIVNTVFEIKEYLDNGITRNFDEYIRKNITGCLFASVSTINDIIPYAKPNEMTLYAKIKVWGGYWKLVNMDKAAKGSRVKKITILGVAGYVYNHLKNAAKFVLRRK